MFKLFKRLLTKNQTQIPLFWVDFNYPLYKEFGKLGSCNLHVHPLLTYNEHVKKTLNELVDYIRENYNMKEM
jgi:hypothetical protein